MGVPKKKDNDTANGRKNEEKTKVVSMIVNWFKVPLFRNAIIISSVFALIIHILYSIPAPCNFLVHEWEAGDVLTYVSTIALGLLAIWQNQKFKEESDKSQEDMERQNSEAQARLERINNEANELSIISRIIDQEDKYLSRVEEAALAFLNASSGDTILNALSDAFDSKDAIKITPAYTKMRHAHDRLMATYLSGMKTNVRELINLIDAIGEVHSEASAVFTKALTDKQFYLTNVDKYSIIHDKAENAIQVFLFERRKVMYRILTEKMTLEEVRAIYSPIEGDISRYGNNCGEEE